MNEKLCPSRQRGVIKSFSLPAHREIPRKEMPQSCANLVSRWKDDKVIPMKSHWALIALLIAIHTGCGNVVTTEKAVRNEDTLTAKRLQVLDAFAEAWNRHDIVALMSMMTEDCAFEASGGPAVNGERFEGQEAVRQAFLNVFAQYPDAHWGEAVHSVQGDLGVSRWIFRGTRPDRSRMEVNGCDFLTFRGEKIAIKDSYRKNRPPIPASSDKK